MKYILLIILPVLMTIRLNGQEINTLITQIKKKLDKIDQYEATGTMKTSIAYLKIPLAKIKIRYKKPNTFTVQSNNGVTFIPKGIDAILLQNLLSNEFTLIDAGKQLINKKQLRVVNLLPISQQSNIVLSTLYINEKELLIEKNTTTTKEEGSYEVEMQYGKYTKDGLPDKLIFTFNSKDYKIPKGLTLDFDNTSSKNKSNTVKANKGRAEIVFEKYRINQIE